MLHEQNRCESFPTIADDQLESLVNFIKSKHSDTELCHVRSDKNDAVVPKGTSVAISCQVNHGPIDKRTPVLFEPDELVPWPSGLIVQDTLLSLVLGQNPPGQNPPDKIPGQNPPGQNPP